MQVVRSHAESIQRLARPCRASLVNLCQIVTQQVEQSVAIGLATAVGHRAPRIPCLDVLPRSIKSLERLVHAVSLLVDWTEHLVARTSRSHPNLSGLCNSLARSRSIKRHAHSLAMPSRSLSGDPLLVVKSSNDYLKW